MLGSRACYLLPCLWVFCCPPGRIFAYICNTGRSPPLLLVQLPFMDTSHHRPSTHWLPRHARLSRRWVCLQIISSSGINQISNTNTSFIVDTLDHFEVPIFGRLANSFVDDEWAGVIVSLDSACIWIQTAEEHVYSSYTPLVNACLLWSFFMYSLCLILWIILSICFL
jgi:hypothetical protein